MFLVMYELKHNKGDELSGRKGFQLVFNKIKRWKSIPARDMNISMIQNLGYINNIESVKWTPSLSIIFYICKYLEITPKDFFDTEVNNPSKAPELYDIARVLY